MWELAGGAEKDYTSACAHTQINKIKTTCLPRIWKGPVSLLAVSRTAGDRELLASPASSWLDFSSPWQDSSLHSCADVFTRSSQRKSRASVYFSEEPSRLPLKIILFSVRASGTWGCNPHALSALCALNRVYPVSLMWLGSDSREAAAKLSSPGVHLLTDPGEALLKVVWAFSCGCHCKWCWNLNML